MQRRKANPKRKIEETPGTDERRKYLERKAREASYTGNPVHKRNPGDFNLFPPASPRPGKTLCDGAEILSRKEATKRLRLGIKKGLVSVAVRDDWPQNVWAVAANGTVLEGMLEDSYGRYHGYPLQSDDPLIDEIRRRWTA